MNGLVPVGSRRSPSRRARRRRRRAAVDPVGGGGRGDRAADARQFQRWCASRPCSRHPSRPIRSSLDEQRPAPVAAAAPVPTRATPTCARRGGRGATRVRRPLGRGLTPRRPHARLRPADGWPPRRTAGAPPAARPRPSSFFQAGAFPHRVQVNCRHLADSAAVSSCRLAGLLPGGVRAARAGRARPRPRRRAACRARPKRSRRSSRATPRSTACCAPAALQEQLVVDAVSVARARVRSAADCAPGGPYRLVRSLDGLLREFEYQIDADRFLRIVSARPATARGARRAGAAVREADRDRGDRRAHRRGAHRR